MNKFIKSNPGCALAQLLVKQSVEVIILLDNKFKVVLFNPMAENVFNCSADKMIGEKFDIICSQCNIDNFLTTEKDKIQSNAITSDIFATINNVKFSWVVFHIKIKNSLYFLLKATSCEEKEKQDEIIRLETLVENMPYNVYWMDKNCVMVGCNRNVLSMLNMTQDEYVGKTYEELSEICRWPEGLAQKLKNDDLTVLRTGQPIFGIEDPPLPHASSNALNLLTSRVPIRNNKGKIIGISGISVDITDRKKMEEDLRIAIKNTETANHGLTLMTGSVVHELRTPLISVDLAILAIKQYLPELISVYQLVSSNDLSVKKISSSDLTMLIRFAENIQAEIKATNIFIDMLLLNLTEPKIIVEKMQDCSIRQCVEMALERYPLAEQEKSRIFFDTKDDFIFKGTQLLTTHIMFNLLKNALYYIKVAEKGEIYIWLECSNEVNKLHFKDTAKGIPFDVIPHIFERFYSKTQGGSGIGLAFCKMTMESFGGEIHCESVEGDYAEFILSFPANPKNNTGASKSCSLTR